MLTNKELIKTFQDAYDEGFVSDLDEPGACNSECDDCPAGDACTQLSKVDTSDDGDFPTFVKNYKALREGTLLEDEGVEDHD